MLIFIMLHLGVKYNNYKTFISKPFYYTEAIVLASYQKIKNTRHYSVLKLRSREGYTFYTTTHKNEDFNHMSLRVQVFPDETITFGDYLGTFYVKSKIKHQEKLPPKFKDRLLEKVSASHSDTQIASFYNAIFFATPLKKELREQIAKLGVSHLVALSGFHLGILWGLIYGLLLLIYRPFQQMFFPYRQALFDVGLIAMSILGSYVWFVDFPPSLVRSYAMVFVGWVVLLLGMELLSFTFLTTITLILVGMFPSLLVSLSFALSVAGVFYIFLLLQYTKQMQTWIITLFVIPLGIFILMLPVVHYTFGVTNVYQLLSPGLSLLFILFYPLVILLHSVGYGDILDTVLLYIFALPKQGTEHYIPLMGLVGYIVLSMGAIWYKQLFLLLMAFAIGYGVYLFV